MVLKDVIATVSTRNRTDTTLPLVITSLLCLTYKPGKFIVYDDNDELKDPRENEIYKNLLNGLVNSGIEWFWIPGQRKGQVFNHEHARLSNDHEFIWRIDDDNILPSNTLEELYKAIKTDKKIGAVGPSILDPKNIGSSKIASNTIEDVYLGMNIQWNYTNTISSVEVEHLQGSTFLYRREAGSHGYNLELSRVGHREETLFTYEMFRNGWKLIAICGLNTWHMRYGAGGIRSHNDIQLFARDDYIFAKKLEQWKVKIKQHKFVFLDSGRGDHYAFKQILPLILKKHKDAKIIIGACYQDVFWDIDNPRITILGMSDIAAFVKPEDHNIYKFMAEKQLKGNLVEAYKQMYL